METIPKRSATPTTSIGRARARRFPCSTALRFSSFPLRRSEFVVAKMLFRLPEAAEVVVNPSPAEVKALTAEMPNAKPTAHGNLNVQTEVVNRSKGSTFIVTDEPDGQNQAISREEGLRWAEAQDAYIAERTMIQIDGHIGNDPDFRTPARLYIEAAN